jgi:hypothetical protein
VLTDDAELASNTKLGDNIQRAGVGAAWATVRMEVIDELISNAKLADNA